MRQSCVLWCAMLLSLVLTVATATADEVRMKNGDRLTGTIVRLEGSLLYLRAPYAHDTLAISWEAVDCLVSGNSLPVAVGDNRFVIGTISCPESGIALIEESPSSPPVPTPLTQVRAINPSTYSGLFSLGGSFYSGNTNANAVSASARFKVKKQRHRFTVDGRYNYGETNGKTAISNSSASFKYDLFTGEKLYGYAQSLTEHDRFADLNLRTTEGLGVGYQLFESKQFNLFVEGGASYLLEDFSGSEDRQDATGRWSLGIDWEVVPGRLTFFHRQEGFYSIIAGSTVLHAEQGLRIPLFENLYANFEADYRFNSAPAAGTRKSDLNLILGITYQYAYW